jgi:hypothetical protein
METVKHLPKALTAARYHVTTRTIDRWHRDEKLGFPEPIVINGRNYYREDELSEFDRRCARRGRETKVA